MVLHYICQKKKRRTQISVCHCLPVTKHLCSGTAGFLVLTDICFPAVWHSRCRLQHCSSVCCNAAIEPLGEPPASQRGMGGTGTRRAWLWGTSLNFNLIENQKSAIVNVMLLGNQAVSHTYLLLGLWETSPLLFCLLQPVPLVSLNSHCVPGAGAREGAQWGCATDPSPTLLLRVNALAVQTFRFSLAYV